MIQRMFGMPGGGNLICWDRNGADDKEAVGSQGFLTLFYVKQIHQGYPSGTRFVPDLVLIYPGLVQENKITAKRGGPLKPELVLIRTAADVHKVIYGAPCHAEVCISV